MKKYICTYEDCTDRTCSGFACMDCGMNTLHENEYYMLTDDTWFAARSDVKDKYKRTGMLCIGCVENRLGRQLRPDDFADVPLNYGPWAIFQSERLASRILGAELR